MLLACAARPNPRHSKAAPALKVMRPPKRRSDSSGKGLDRPQAMPSSEKLRKASVIDQCSSPAMVNSTTPSEVKVARFRKQNASETAAKTIHLLKLFKAIAPKAAVLHITV